MNYANAQRVCKLMEQSDGILIGSGAGLTAAAGISYTDRDAFARIFPAWKKRGFSMQYQFVGHRDWTPLEMWGYWVVHLGYVYYGQSTNPLYAMLRRLIGDKSYFVMTSNVDELFHKNGFDLERIFTPQGSYGKIQCTTPCCEQVWDMKPFYERLLESFDPIEQIITNEAAIPVCPKCGGTMFPNVRADDTMVDRHFASTRERLLHWVQGMAEKKLLLLELGSGYNTPVVIRMPMERITAGCPKSTLVRVNMDHPEVPEQIVCQSISVQGDIATFIKQVALAY